VAASSLTHLDAGAARVANAQLISALQSLAHAYFALDTSASRNDQQGYAAAQGAIARAGLLLSAAFAKLRSFGYRVR
jgi:hypothetical protein